VLFCRQHTHRPPTHATPCRPADQPGGCGGNSQRSMASSAWFLCDARSPGQGRGRAYEAAAPLCRIEACFAPARCSFAPPGGGGDSYDAYRRAAAGRALSQAYGAVAGGRAVAPHLLGAASCCVCGTVRRAEAGTRRGAAESRGSSAPALSGQRHASPLAMRVPPPTM